MKLSLCNNRVHGIFSGVYNRMMVPYLIKDDGVLILRPMTLHLTTLKASAARFSLLAASLRTAMFRIARSPAMLYVLYSDRVFIVMDVDKISALARN